jgi:MFS family permease
MDTTNAWTRRQWFLIVMISAMHGLNHAFYMMLTPLFVDIKEHFEFDKLFPAMAVGSAFLLPYAIAHLPCGWLADRLNKSRIIGLGGLGTSALLVVAGFVPRYGVLLAAVALAGICAASYHGVAAALITTVYSNTRGRALGIAGVGSAVGLTGAPALSGWIAGHYSWQASFITFGVIGAAFSLFFFAVVRERGDSRGDSGGSPPSLAGVIGGTIALMAVFMGLREFCGWGSFSLVPTFARVIHLYSTEQAGYVAACVTLAGTVSGPLFGVLSDRKGRAQVLFPLLALSSVSIVIVPMLGPLAMPVGAIIFGFFYTATVPIFDAYVGDAVPDRLKGRAFGITMSIGIGVGALSVVATAAVADAYMKTAAGFQVTFLMLAAGTALAIIPLMKLRRRLG